jgi:thioredoxin-dependent peroxiredoxin
MTPGFLPPAEKNPGEMDLLATWKEKAEEHMLKQGDKAPSFTLDSDSGAKVSLAKLKGPVVVYFYPKDDTPGCTVEAKEFAAAQKRLAALGATVLGVSKDSIQSHCKFRDKYKLNFPLLSDPDLSVHRAFGAFGPKTLYGKKFDGVIRSTFVIHNGTIAHAYPSVKVAGHVERVLADLAGGTKGEVRPKASSKKAETTTSITGAAPKPGSAKKASTKTPAAKRATAKTPAAKKATAKTPAAKKATAKTPAAKKATLAKAKR